MQKKNSCSRQKNWLGRTKSNDVSNNNFRQPKLIYFSIRLSSFEQDLKQLKIRKNKSITGNFKDNTRKKSPHTSNYSDGNKNKNFRQSRFISFILSNL